NDPPSTNEERLLFKSKSKIFPFFTEPTNISFSYFFPNFLNRMFLVKNERYQNQIPIYICRM
ncbi:MAG: hypothetical protein ACRD7F_09050, partial [Nitrososphaeraceae archaeon]